MKNYDYVCGEFKQQKEMKTTVLYGCKIEAPDYMEEVLYECKGYVNKDELLDHASKWAKENNYNRLRISVYDLNEKPNFIKSINL